MTWFQVRDERRDAEYLCLSYNPFVDVVAVGEDNGHIKVGSGSPLLEITRSKMYGKIENQMIYELLYNFLH